MSTLREAAQAALDYFDSPGDACFSDADVERLRAALAEQQAEWSSSEAGNVKQPQPEPVGEIYRFGRNSAGVPWHGFSVARDVDLPEGTKLFTAPQPQQAPQPEPVAWYWRHKENDATGLYWQNPSKYGIDMGNSLYEWTLLYAAPQPQRAPLSDDQIAALTIMLDQHKNDPRTECLRTLVYGGEA
jgi:hypothetical protein